MTDFATGKATPASEKRLTEPGPSHQRYLKRNASQKSNYLQGRYLTSSNTPKSSCCRGWAKLSFFGHDVQQRAHLRFGLPDQSWSLTRWLPGRKRWDPSIHPDLRDRESSCVADHSKVLEESERRFLGPLCLFWQWVFGRDPRLGHLESDISSHHDGHVSLHLIEAPTTGGFYFRFFLCNVTTHTLLSNNTHQKPNAHTPGQDLCEYQQRLLSDKTLEEQPAAFRLAKNVSF